MKFRVCRPDYDETDWHEVEAISAEYAAETLAREVCSCDPENYSSFDGDGEILLVRGHGQTVCVRVSVEMVPSFSSRRMQ